MNDPRIAARIETVLCELRWMISAERGKHDDKAMCEWLDKLEAELDKFGSPARAAISHGGTDAE